MPDQQETRLGQQIGEYRLVRKLGGGGFGTVYLAEHVHEHTQAAVKVLDIRLTKSEDFKEFLNEARTMRLRHPHIVPLLDFGISRDDLPFLVMEYAPEGTLRDRHPKGKRLPLSTIVSYVDQLASALQYAHDQRIIHRDIKPENILVRADGTLLVSDFGIAKLLEQSVLLSVQTQVGTPVYMAPEQYMGHPCFASDQYALAVVTYEWTSGVRPFQGPAIGLAVQHINTPPPSLRAQIPELSEAVERVIFQALAKAPEDRFERIQKFADALREAVQPPIVLSPTIETMNTAPLIAPEQVSRQASGLKPEALVPALKDTKVARIEPAMQKVSIPVPRKKSTSAETFRNGAIPFPQKRPLGRRLPLLTSIGLGLIALVIVVYSASALLTGPFLSGRTNISTQSVVTIEIGSEFPTSQADASAGKPAENGVRYAIDKANEANFLPGYKFVINAKDDVGANGTHDPNVGANNISQLVGNTQVAAVVGPLNSSVAKAEMPVANQADIALLSPANTNDCLTQETPADQCGGANSFIAPLRPTGKVTYFRTATRDQYQGIALAQFAYKEKGYKTVYVIDDTETYGASLATNFINAFKGYGGTVIDRKSIAPTSSYENALTAVAVAKPDVLFFGGNDSTGGITIRQQMATTPGLQNLPFLAGDGNKTSAFAKAIAPLKGGPVYNTIPGTDPIAISESKDFYTNFQKTYGQIGAYSAAAYDTTEIILNAVKYVITTENVLPPTNPNDSTATKTFRQKVIEAIQKTDYSGLTGHHTFDTNGDTTNRSISFYTLGDDPNVGDGWKYLKAIDPTK